VNLYLRLLFLLCRLIGLPRKGPLEESRVAFRVLPTDCDVNLHMNNGRYLSFMDLGRLHLVAQFGLLRVILRKRWGAALGAVEINFIRPLEPFQKFELVTRIVTWDEKYGYMEQRFESGGVLCAHAFAKGLFLEKGARVGSSVVAAELGIPHAPPPMPEELRIWSELGNVKKQNA
jgi:acyl-CoA thioesterase FadM